jgi:phosphatidylglycerophosphatase A
MTTSDKSLHFIAAGLGSGWLPKAPGTWGSLAALLPAWLMVEQWGIESLFIATGVVTLLGCRVCYHVLPSLSSDDPGWIVIDEWAGQWLATALIGTFTTLALPTVLVSSFILFRLFDVLKPWPISWLERVGPKWWSIMADDIGAGLIGGLLGILLLPTLAGLL